MQGIASPPPGTEHIIEKGCLIVCVTSSPLHLYIMESSCSLVPLKSLSNVHTCKHALLHWQYVNTRLVYFHEYHMNHMYFYHFMFCYINKNLVSNHTHLIFSNTVRSFSFLLCFFLLSLTTSLASLSLLFSVLGCRQRRPPTIIPKGNITSSSAERSRGREVRVAEQEGRVGRPIVREAEVQLGRGRPTLFLLGRGGGRAVFLTRGLRGGLLA